MLLQAKNLAKRYGGTIALNQVSLDLHGGEVHALMGENGSGKSTLVKIISGVVLSDSGELTIDGQQVKAASPRKAAEYGVATVFQELTLFPNMTVAENIFVGREPIRFLRLDQAAMEEQARAIFQMFGRNIEVSAPVRTLSLADQQLVELAKAVSFNPKLLILDEATSSLGNEDAEIVLNVAREFKRRGAIVLFISHRFHEVFSIADKITVLRDGQFITTLRAEDLNSEQLFTLMLGEKSDNIFPEKNKPEPAEPKLIVEQVRNEYLNGISFQVRPGEICGIAGLQGHGQIRLLETLFGLHPVQQGRICVNGTPVSLRNNRMAMKRNIAFTPSDRKTQALHLELPIQDNLLMASWDELSVMGWLKPKQCRDIVSLMMNRLAVKAGDRRHDVKTLSGGNQQKIVLGKWLARKPQILLLDDPTRGIDVGAKKEFYHLIRELSQNGLAVVIVSSEIEELVGLCDQVVVMYEGGISRILQEEDIHHESILSAMFGSKGEAYA